MFNGPLPARRLPKQDLAKILRIAEWWWLASKGMEEWAQGAKECVDFLESKQWTDEELATLKAKNRAHFIFNKISPLFRLMVGYHGNNQTEWKFQPGNDGVGTETIAEVITQIVKQVGKDIDLEEVDSEVFQDGITTGRGYWETRMSWEENDFGEMVSEALDPFAVYPDPDLQDYDLNKGNFIQKSKFLSLDEIEWFFGKQAADRLTAFMHGGVSIDSFPSIFSEIENEIGPRSTFSHLEPGEFRQQFRDILGHQFVDRSRKAIRMVDTQYYVRRLEDVFVDLETGVRAPIPKGWGPVEIAKAIEHGKALQNEITVAKRMVRRVHWTVMVGDIIVHDEPSPYETFTIHGFFPYFRRGMTRGMVHDLRDPQREINKRRNAEIEAVTRNSGGGWIYTEQSMTPEQESNLKRFGSSAGFNLKWRGTQGHEPRRIEPAQPAHAAERLEDRARQDLRDVTGFNEAALGELDKVQSGRALEARQRQAVLAVQMYLSNYSRAKKLGGRKVLELVQQHMRDERMFRIIGEDGQLSQILINQQQRDPETGRLMRLNDVTLGKYSLVIDETPLVSTFANAQFEEAMAILERVGGIMGPQLAAAISDIVVQMSSLPQPQKDQITERIQQVAGLPPPGTPLQPAGAELVSAVPGTVPGPRLPPTAGQQALLLPSPGG